MLLAFRAVPCCAVPQGFFDQYVGACLFWMKINVKPIVPVEDMALVQVMEATITMRCK